MLEQIVRYKRDEVARRKTAVSARQLEQHPQFDRQPRSACQAIRRTGSTGIIAEFKRKSPSKGVINNWADVTRTTQGYVNAGAACLSVLTDMAFFGGSPSDLQQARQTNPTTPILRKDFIVEPYQVLESKVLGADLVLLIAACLTPKEILELGLLAHQLGMEVLLEVHDEDELNRSLNDQVDLVGVNNRNLSTFTTSIDTSLRLANMLPDSYLWVAESGLRDASTIRQLRQVGYEGFLIGEAFMKTLTPANALAALVSGLPHQQFCSKPIAH